MNQDNSDLNHLAESWIADWELRHPDNERPEASDSVDKVSHFHLDEEHDALWKFILATYRKPMSPRVFAILAAGPLEDLLASFGRSILIASRPSHVKIRNSKNCSVEFGRTQ